MRLSHGTALASLDHAPRAGSTMGELLGLARAVPVAGGINQLCAPELVRPQQIPRTHLSDVQPERRLMLAVLEQAILDVATLEAIPPAAPAPAQRWRRERRRELRGANVPDARAWLESDDRDYLFAFRSICDTFGFNATAIRERVLSPQFTHAKTRVCVVSSGGG